MLKLFKAALRGFAMLCGATLESGYGLGSWLLRTTWEGWTGRSLAAEAAEREQAQARADEQAQAQADAAARHEETALLAERQLAATEQLRDELMRAARRPLTQAVTVQPRWLPVADDEHEPDGGTPAPAYA